LLEIKLTKKSLPISSLALNLEYIRSWRLQDTNIEDLVAVQLRIELMNVTLSCGKELGLSVRPLNSISTNNSRSWHVVQADAGENETSLISEQLNIKCSWTLAKYTN
jgi:hypothetical protein